MITFICAYCESPGAAKKEECLKVTCLICGQQHILGVCHECGESTVVIEEGTTCPR